MDNVKKYTHSNFFTNRDNNTLIKEFEGILHHNPHICNLDAVVGFLRASGYFSLRPFLDNINKVRVLIGINVDNLLKFSNLLSGNCTSNKARKDIFWSRRRSKRRVST